MTPLNPMHARMTRPRLIPLVLEVAIVYPYAIDLYPYAIVRRRRALLRSSSNQSKRQLLESAKLILGYG